MNASIKKICGDSEITPNFEEISNDPNFVFPPDPLYETKVLFDLDGNIVNVNSWLECANYVNGGWFSEVSDLINYEQRLFFILVAVFSIIPIKHLATKYIRGRNSKT